MSAPTLTELAQAFQLWENEYRVDPSNFMTPEEAHQLGVSELAAKRAAYFAELLARLRAEGPL